jgi:hypothetical protein
MTVKEEGLPAVAWGDPEGKGMMGRISEIEFDNDFNKSQEIKIPATKEETKSVENKAQETVTKTEDQKVETKSIASEEEDIIDEDFFGGDKEKIETKTEDEKKTDSFDEKAFDAETEEQSKGLDEKAGSKFKALRAELKELKSKSGEVVVPEETKKELETLRIKSEEVDGLKRRIEELSSASAKTKVENSDDYRIEVIKPASVLFDRADELSKSYELAPEILQAIIKESDRKRQNELIAANLKDFSDFDRNEAYRMIQDFRGLVAKREMMLSEAETFLEKQEAKKIEEQTKFINDQKLAVQKIQKEIWNKYKDVIPGLVEDGAETDVLKELRSRGMSIDFSTSRAKDQAFAAFAGTILPHIVKKLNALTKQLAEQDNSDKQAVASRPKLGESLTPSNSGSELRGSSFMDRLQEVDFV